jgi:hypothetical protein
MTEPMVQVGATGMCPHGGPLQIVPSQVKVLLGGQPAATASDTFTITGCAFTLPNGTPSPCVTATFRPAVKVMLGGNPAVLQSGGLICQSAAQLPQGPPTVTVAQLKVTGT